jgi:hypothetical protein
MAGNLLHDVFDMHVHCAPDIVERKTDDIELAKAAADAGMGGILLKSHCGSTVERAYLVKQMTPGLHVYGGVVLNLPVGGLNPNAVEIYVRMGAKEIWMPTFSAQAMSETRRKQKIETKEIAPQGNANIDPPAANKNGWKGGNWPWYRNGLGISILGEDGKLLQEVWQILEIMATGEAILGTGHISIPETHALIKAAQEMRVGRLLITHPEYMAPMSLDDQISLAKKGVFFERCYITTRLPKYLGPDLSLKTLVNNIRAVGIESNILATDFGQPTNEHPVKGMLEFIEKLREAGFRESDLELMATKTPKILLGLD